MLGATQHQSEFRRYRAKLLEDGDALVKDSVVKVMLDEDGPQTEIGYLGFDYTDYNILTVRTAKASGSAIFNAFVSFVDHNGEAHEWAIPGEVVRRIADHIGRLTSENRSRRAKGRKLGDQPQEGDVFPAGSEMEQARLKALEGDWSPNQTLITSQSGGNR